ncbi:MAG: replication endonuclease [Sideroxyarcus sp.]|nr:replication endonuclease [Sideroxyarcus sp.]
MAHLQISMHAAARAGLYDRLQADFVREQCERLPWGLRTAAAHKHKTMLAQTTVRESNTWIRESADKITVLKSPIVAALEIDAQGEDFDDAAERKAAFYTTQITQKNKEEVVRLAEKTNKIEISGKTVDAQILRITDKKFWKRRIRKELRQWREKAHLLIMPEKMRWVSSDGSQEYKYMLAAHERWAANYCFISNTGQTVAAPTPAQSAQRRYAELIAKTKGIETLATKRGLKAVFITLTLDTNFHSSKIKNRGRIANSEYDNSTPKDGHIFLTKQWARFRAQMKKREIDYEFVQAVHAHKNSTPHRHLVLWCAPEQKKEIIDLIYTYFKTNPVAAQIKIEEPQNSASAVAYCSRILAYLTRHLDSKTDNKKTKGDREKDEKEAEAVSAWASTWSIRRYSTSISKSTIWKLARNAGTENVPTQIKAAATSGDYATFLKECENLNAKISYENKKNSYGETYKKPVGIKFDGGIALKTTTWEIVKVTVNIKSQENQNQKQKTELTDLETGEIIFFETSQDPPPTI